MSHLNNTRPQKEALKPQHVSKDCRNFRTNIIIHMYDYRITGERFSPPALIMIKLACNKTFQFLGFFKYSLFSKLKVSK